MSLTNPFFTIFTPVYNSKDTIHRVWESLNSQSFKSFEWIIIDDGSDDNIKPIVDEFIKSKKFKIIFYRQPNKGKHIAWNKALKLASGLLFIPADSDDRFDKETLSFFYDKWINLTNLEKNNFSGINVLCKDNIKGEVVGDMYPSNYFKTNLLDLTYKYKIHGEKWGCIRLDLLKKYPYPEIIGRGSYILSYTWFSLSKNYSILCFNKILRTYYIDSESITNQKNFIKKRIRESETRVHFIRWHFENNAVYLVKNSPIDFFKLILAYTNFWLYSTNRKKYKFRDIKPLFVRLILLLFFIPTLFYNIYERKFK